jgi:3',5'-cyclic-AMP phosphodiesterase
MRIIQLTDLHFTGRYKDDGTISESYQRLNLVLSAIKSQIDEDTKIVLTGDLVTNPTPDLYVSLSSVFHAVQAEVFAVPGNHDSDEMMKKYFFGNNILDCDKFISENWILLFLDSSLPGKALGSGKLSEIALKKLHSDLDTFREKKVIIFIHHPAIEFGAKWFRRIKLENSQVFNHIINQYRSVKSVIFGHGHTQYVGLINDKAYICGPPIWKFFNHDNDVDLEYVEHSPGYNWYALHQDGSISFGTSYV